MNLIRLKHRILTTSTASNKTFCHHETEARPQLCVPSGMWRLTLSVPLSMRCRGKAQGFGARTELKFDSRLHQLQRFSIRSKLNNICKPPVQWKRVNTFQFLPLSPLLEFSSLHEFATEIPYPNWANLFPYLWISHNTHPSPPQLLSVLFSVNLIGHISLQDFFSGAPSVVWIPWDPFGPALVAVTILIGIWLCITLPSFQISLYLWVFCIPDYVAKNALCCCS